jgi:hypothetical protein
MSNRSASPLRPDGRSDDEVSGDQDDGERAEPVHAPIRPKGSGPASPLRPDGRSPLPAVSGTGSDKASTQKFQSYYDRILAHSGHRIRSIGEKRSVAYQCGTCGAERSSYLSNLLKSGATRYCSACVNANMNKKDDEDVRARLDAAGMADYQLVAYADNKHVKLVCPRGHPFETAMNALVGRGRRCPTCAPVRRAATNVERYGCSNVCAAPAIKRKIEETLTKNYGGHHMKLPAIQKKRDETMMATHDGLKYAFRSDDALANGRAACEAKYGTKFPLQSPIVQETMKANSREKFGCDHPMQNAAEFSRRQYRLKDYTFPSGRIVKVQGYEPQFIDELLKTRGEDEIVVDQRLIPSIRYMRVVDAVAGSRATLRVVRRWGPCGPDHSGRTNAESSSTAHDVGGVEKESVYHPDMRVGSRLYEVKCRYTFESEKSRNLAKFRACADQGYELDVVIFNDAGSLIEEILKYRPTESAAANRAATGRTSPNMLMMPPIGRQALEAKPIEHSVSDAYDRRRLEDQRRMVKERSGHNLLTIAGKTASFECGTCGYCDEKALVALARKGAPRTCSECSKRNVRKTGEMAQAELIAKGVNIFTVVSYEDETRVTVRCENGHVQTAKFANLVRSGKCHLCC